MARGGLKACPESSYQWRSADLLPRKRLLKAERKCLWPQEQEGLSGGRLVGHPSEDPHCLNLRSQ